VEQAWQAPLPAEFLKVPEGHAWQVGLDEPPQGPVSCWPAGQEEVQLEHWVFSVGVHGVEMNWLSGQVVVHVAQVVSDEPEQPPVWYEPASHGLQRVQMPVLLDAK
jgi:hypothetical protein